MDLKEYTTLATRTESIIPEVVSDREALHATVKGMIAFGQILDQFKKNIFYGKPFNTEKLSENLASVEDQLQVMLSGARLMKAGETKEGISELNPRVFHAIVGAATESVELLEVVDTLMSGGEFDLVNALEEFFDINWYEAIAMDELGGDWEGGLENNIAKLKARFPDKFDSDKAINRNLENEREILEQMVEKE